MFCVFSAVFLCLSKGFLGFRGGERSLVFWLAFLGLYLNTKEKKIREVREIWVMLGCHAVTITNEDL